MVSIRHQRNVSSRTAIVMWTLHHTIWRLKLQPGEILQWGQHRNRRLWRLPSGTPHFIINPSSCTITIAFEDGQMLILPSQQVKLF